VAQAASTVLITLAAGQFPCSATPAHWVAPHCAEHVHPSGLPRLTGIRRRNPASPHLRDYP
jgi:hypothetical protein